MMLTKLAKLLGRIDGGPPRLRISDAFANVPVVDQFGQAYRFRDDLVGDRALIISTMYTVCRGSCPATNARIESLRERLSPVFGGRLAILSITLDPVGDSPRALRRYASIYGADQPREGLCDWLFLTGAATDVDRLRRSLGFYDLDPRVDSDLSRHAAVLLFGNPGKDRWATLPSDLREPLIVETVRRVAGFTFEQKYGIKG